MFNKMVPSTDKNHYIQFLKYLFVGGSAALLDFSTFIVALNAIEKTEIGFSKNLFGTTPAAIANTLGILIGFLWSFLLNKYWAFRAQGNTKTQLFLVSLLLLSNITITNFLITILHYDLDISSEWAKILMQIAVVGWNYLLYQYFIFKNN